MVAYRTQAGGAAPGVDDQGFLYRTGGRHHPPDHRAVLCLLRIAAADILRNGLLDRIYVTAIGRGNMDQLQPGDLRSWTTDLRPILNGQPFFLTGAFL